MPPVTRISLCVLLAALTWLSSSCGSSEDEAVLPPGLPIDVTAEAGVREAHVAWTAPEPKRGAPVHAYTVRASPGDIAVTVPGKDTRATVPGLANGTMYTFTVQASNPVGEGPLSVPSQPITTPDLPGAVEIRTVSVEATRATLTWSHPGFDGGSPLTGYVVSAQPGNVQVSVAGNVTTATLEGLANATRYTFTVQARNAVGDGPRSDAWVTSTLCGAVSLVSSGEVAVGDLPGEVATADFNGDGKADLAVSNGQDASVSVLLGQGDGHFQAARRVPVGNAPRDVSAADFNRDGKADLAVLNTQDASVSVLLGRGDGTFGTQRTFPTGTSPQVMTTQDFTGDGVLDLFTANSSIPLRSYTATLLRGDGTGAFTSTNYTTGLVAHGMTGADVDADGKLDLVLADYYGGELKLYQGVGDGTFGTVTTVSPLTYPNHVRATDLDSDGRVDLVVTDQFRVITYYGQAAGGVVRKNDLTIRSIARALALTDLDGDGRQDIVVSNGAAQVVSVFQGASTGGFSERWEFPLAAEPSGLALADFNGDGHADVAVAQGAHDSVRILATRCGR